MKKIRTILHTINIIKKLEVKGLRSYSCVLFILNILKSLNEVYSIIMLKIIFDILYTKKNCINKYNHMYLINYIIHL